MARGGGARAYIYQTPMTRREEDFVSDVALSQSERRTGDHRRSLCAEVRLRSVLSRSSSLLIISSQRAGARGDALTAAAFKSRWEKRFMEPVRVHRFAAARPGTDHIKESEQVP